MHQQEELKSIFTSLFREAIVTCLKYSPWVLQVKMRFLPQYLVTSTWKFPLFICFEHSLAWSKLNHALGHDWLQLLLDNNPIFWVTCSFWVVCVFDSSQQANLAKLVHAYYFQREHFNLAIAISVHGSFKIFLILCASKRQMVLKGSASCETFQSSDRIDPTYSVSLVTKQF